MTAPGAPPTPEELAEVFHDTYERLAPQFGYMTRPDSRTPWASVPDKNRQLMIATCAEILARLRPACMTTEEDTRFVRDLDERQIETCNKSTGYRLHLKADEVNRIVRVLEAITKERDALRADLREYKELLARKDEALRACVEALVQMIGSHNRVNTRTLDDCGCKACRGANAALARPGVQAEGKSA